MHSNPEALRYLTDSARASMIPDPIARARRMAELERNREIAAAERARQIAEVEAEIEYRRRRLRAMGVDPDAQ